MRKKDNEHKNPEQFNIRNRPSETRQSLINVIKHIFLSIFIECTEDEPQILFNELRGRNNNLLSESVHMYCMKLLSEHIHCILFHGISSIICNDEEVPLMELFGNKYDTYF